METSPLCKLEVQRIVGVHLGMYLPSVADDNSSTNEIGDKLNGTERAKFEREDTEVLRSIKEEDEEEEISFESADTKE